MQEVINKIIKQNPSFFWKNPTIEKINVGFTNTIYKINDLLIIKICTNSDNEKVVFNFITDGTKNVI